MRNELFPRNHQDSAAHQYQSDEDGAVQHAVFRQDDGGEQHPGHRGDEVEHRHMAYRVVLQQNTPQGVGSGGDEGHVQEQQQGCWGSHRHPAAEEEGHDRHGQSAGEKLPAGKQHRVVVPGEDFNQNRRHGGSEHGKEDEPFPVPGEAEIHRLTDGLHQEHPGKPQEAADEFFYRHFLQPEHIHRQQDCHEGAGPVDDGGAHRRGAGQAHIKEDILQDCLEQGQRSDGLPIGFLR